MAVGVNSLSVKIFMITANNKGDKTLDTVVNAR